MYIKNKINNFKIIKLIFSKYSLYINVNNKNNFTDILNRFDAPKLHMRFSIPFFNMTLEVSKCQMQNVNTVMDKLL